MTRWPAALLVAALAVLTKFRLTEHNARIAVRAPHDDLYFVDHARSLIDGRWFGDYGDLTLIKGPFYPLFIAAMHQLHLPLFAGESILYACACGAAVLALAPLVRAAALRVAAFIILLFNPFTFDATTDRVIRGDVMPSLTLLVAALSIGIFLRRDARPAGLALAGAALGAVLGAFFLTREEGVWIVAFLLPMAVATIALAVPRTPAALLARSLPVAVATLVMLACSVAVAAANGAHYGWFTTVEVTAPEFTTAYGALARIVPPPSERGDSRIPVTAAALDAAYRVSPAARELQPFLARSYPAAARASCEQLRTCGGVNGGWFLWIVRDAVAESGHYATGGEARRFYRELATEIDAACAARRLACTPNPHRLAPRVPLAAAPRIAGDAVRAAMSLTAFGGLSFDRSLRSDPAVAEVFRSVTGDPIAPADRAEQTPVPAAARAIGTIYRSAVPWLAALAGLAFALRLVLWWRERRFDAVAFIALSLAAASATLLVLLTVIDDFSFPALNQEYLKPLHVTMLLGVVLVIAASIDERLRGRLGAPDARPPGTTGRRVCVAALATWAAVAGLVATSAALASLAPAHTGGIPRPARSALDARALRALRELRPAAPTASIDGVQLFERGTWVAQPNGALRVRKGALLNLNGWAADPRTLSPARHLLLIVDARRRTDVTAWYGSGRVDVAAAYGKSSMHFTGFSIPVRSTDLGLGDHVLRLGIVPADGSGFYPSRAVSISVR